jgi:hypothetical protein
MKRQYRVFVHMRALDRAIQLERLHEAAVPVAEGQLVDLGDGHAVLVECVRQPTDRHLGTITGRPAWTHRRAPRRLAAV